MEWHIDWARMLVELQRTEKNNDKKSAVRAIVEDTVDENRTNGK
jgi:hypothetical protein